MPDHPPAVAGKLDALESVRGLAALAVVASHLVVGFFPQWYFAPPRPVPPWLRVWYQGDFAVDLFFVLSGFVLALSFVRTGRVEALRSAAVRRYGRLAVPVSAAVALSYLLHRSGLYANRDAARLMGLPDTEWLSRWFAFKPSAGWAVREATWGAYLSFDIDRTYNPVLWTMFAEFVGSLFLFSALALFGGLRNRGVAYAILAAVFLRIGWVWLVEFLAGAVVCELYHRGRPAPILGAAAVVGGLLLAGLSPDWLAATTGFTVPAVAVRHAKPLAALLVLAGVLACGPVQRGLSARPLVLLGRLSFPLYLVHLLVECSLGCRVYVACVGSWRLSHAAAFTWTAAATLAVSLPLAWLGAVTVEPLSVWLGRWVYAAAFEPRPLAVNDELRGQRDGGRLAA